MNTCAYKCTQVVLVLIKQLFISCECNEKNNIVLISNMTLHNDNFLLQ